MARHGKSNRNQNPGNGRPVHAGPGAGAGPDTEVGRFTTPAGPGAPRHEQVRSTQVEVKSDEPQQDYHGQDIPGTTKDEPTPDLLAPRTDYQNRPVPPVADHRNVDEVLGGPKPGVRVGDEVYYNEPVPQLQGFATMLRAEMTRDDLPHDQAQRLGGLLHAVEEFQGRLNAIAADLGPDLAAHAKEITAKL